MKVVWNRWNKAFGIINGEGPFEVLDHAHVFYKIINKYGEEQIWYKDRFDVISEELVELEDML